MANEIWGRNPLPPLTPDGAAHATVTIASISDQDWYIARTYGVFHIPSRPEDEPYGLLIVSSRADALDLGDGRRFPFTISARDIADDIVQDLACHGVFVCRGARPSADELRKAAETRDQWYKQLVFDGDQMWARSHNYREISDMQRRAAISMGLEREWAYVPLKMVDCPVCGEKVKPGVALCRHCQSILDPEIARRHGVTRHTSAKTSHSLTGVGAVTAEPSPRAAGSLTSSEAGPEPLP